jgi:guanylate kinase
MAGILFIISAPSGSGKSTLVSQLRTLVEGLDFSVSYTTRAPRGSEEDGREYHFIRSRETFERMIAEGEFLEWAEVFGSNYYGTGFSALEKARAAGKDLLLDIDVQGAVQVMRKLPAGGLDLRSAAQPAGAGDAPAQPQRGRAHDLRRGDCAAARTQARNELKQVWDYKYALVNDVLDQAVAEMRAIVLYERGVRDGLTELAASCRTDARSARLNAALESFHIG